MNAAEGIGVVAALGFIAMANDERGRTRLRLLDEWIQRRWRDFRQRKDPPGRHADPGRRRATRRETRRRRR